jgi:phosphate butyryltransferase
MNITPSLDDKVKIINNAVKLARLFGFERVRVAALSALEIVNPAVYGSVDAKLLSEMDWGNDVVVAGPLALDNALDSESATRKGIYGEVVGNADILLAPEICSGNILFKGSHFFGNLPSAGVVCGSKSPIVFTSRSDTHEQKYFSILTAILQTQL